MEKKTIGSFIAVLRKAAGMTQKQLAEKLNVSDKAVSRWERDETLPDLTLIPVLAEIFGVTSDELLRGCRSNAEAPTAQAEEKTKKQLKYLLDKAKTDYQIRTLISVTVAFLGVISAAILNLAFLRAVAGFWVGCVFFLVAAVLQTIFSIQMKSKLRAEDFGAEALAACKKTIGSYTYWGFAVVAILFAFTLPLATVPDSHWGLSPDMWVGWDNAFFTRQPGLWVGLAAGLIWFIKEKRRGNIQITPKGKLRIWTICILISLFLITLTLQMELRSNLRTHPNRVGFGTEYTNAQEFKALMELPLDEEGNDQKTVVMETYPDGSPSLIGCWNGNTIDHFHIQHTAQLDTTIQYFDLNHTIDSLRTWDDQKNHSVWVFTHQEIGNAYDMIGWILLATCLVYPAEIAAAVLIYKKKAKKLS